MVPAAELNYFPSYVGKPDRNGDRAYVFSCAYECAVLMFVFPLANVLDVFSFFPKIKNVFNRDCGELSVIVITALKMFVTGTVAHFLAKNC